ALSLNGELGFAFGARGRGGNAMAHYEPDKVVINLTKTKGAGSLAHEWWHALDNYFSKKRGVELGYVTSDARSFGQNEVVRKEMIDAFKDIMIAIGKSGVPTRSRKLDSTKSKSYWESKEEMSARSFENYIVGKMSENGNRNDYLANYRDLVEWAGESNLDESTYPYPTKDESPEINEKFQQFFDTIEEVSNDETGNVMLNEPQSQLDWQHDTDHVSQMEVTPELEKVREEAGYKAEDTGEVTYMERQLSEQGHLTFMGAPLTGAPKIHSSADVAFLFKNLESAATENSFMVMIREDGTYGVYYASTGATAATVVDIKLLVAAAKDFGAARVCFVHNHPSGNLTSSPQDKVIHKRLRSALPGMGIDLMDSIVINLDSGQYLEFDEYGGGKQSKDADPKEIVKPKIYQFDKQVLYQPSLERMRIQSSDDVAKFLSIQKRGAVPKIQALVVDAANRVSKYMFLDPNMSRTELVSTLLYEIGKHGENVIFASNAQIDPSLIQSLRQRLESAGIGNSNTGNPAILDVLEIQQDADIINNYKSWANEGVLEPNSEYNILNERQNNVSLNDIINENGEINYENLEEVSRRTESGDTTITRLNPEEEQGRIRGGRKAIEASILSGAARRPDRGRLPTTGAETAKVEESILKKYAEDTSSLLSREDIESMSVRKFPSGQESEVYESKDGENVIKIVNYKMYSETPLEFLDNRISLNNYIFPETAYKLIGFTETKNGLSFVLEQPFIQGSNLNKFAISVESLVKQQSRVFDHMKDELGASMIGTSRTGFYNDNYVIEDLHLNNVKEGADGNLYFIDSVISLNEESDNLGGYRKYEDFSIGNTNAESAQSVSEPVPSYPQKPNLSEDKDIQVSSEAPAAYPNESIIDYAKRVSLWWNAKQKEVDKTTQDFNKATAELRKLRYSYNQITKKYNQGSKEILERTKNTAKEIETYIRENLDSEIADWMGLGELRGLLARLHNPTSKKDVESAILAIDKTLNIIERRKNRKMLDALLMTKVLDQNKKGVSIAKTVDDDTRKSIEYIRENQELSEAEIDQRIENIENSATNGLIPEEEIQTISDLEMIRLLSRINAFENNIKQIDQEIKDENKRASDEINGIDPGDKAALKDARFTHRRISQSLQRERIIAQSDLNNAYSDAINELNSLITNGRSKLAEQKRKELERRNVIAREAVGAVKDKPVLSQAAEKERSKLDKFKEFLQTNKLKELFLSPQGNLNFMLKYIDRNHPMGEGKLYKRFMKSEEGAVQANENYYLGEREFRKEIKEKAEKIFDAKFSQIIDDSRQNSGIYLEYYDRAGEKHTSKMTKGELMYLYMVSRMEDGKEKLEFMGITDDNINQIANNLGSRYLQMADWIQKEFLPEKRKKYNATHKRLFGTSMAKRENYFPLQYNTKDIQPNSDIANLNNSYYMPSTMTGNIINRVRNKHQIDINANAFDVLMKHGRDMEEWNAYAPLRRDFNGLLNNGYVRNLIEANDKLAFKKLKDAVVVATRAHQEDPNASHFLADLNRRFAGAAIAFRLNTALKQLLSLPAFLEYSNSPKYIGRLFRNLSPDVWAKNFEWAKENLPGFLERWESGNFGNEKLLVDQWENSNKRRSKLEKGLDTYAKIGMWPNRLVDAFA
ncbi:hypothetical protein LJC52_05570, partial [Bacteroidales bacterium OttesenSCG-928-A17]|nr:hypothetical protein [Bacteroidales bacterium OttesenSCG-928-A17]